MTNNLDKKYKIMIVDDELQARKLLINYIDKIPMLNLIASESNAIDAQQIMKTEHIDILLLDIHMPEISGMEFAKSLPIKPEIIFTTAFSEYAVDSFELNATDYLLKPVSFNRFFQAITKATERLLANAALSFMDNMDNASKHKENYIVIRADHRIYKVYHDDLLYIEGQREYVTFHTTTRRITAYYSLKNLEEELPKGTFARIHKSYIVSIPHIDIIESGGVIIKEQRIPIGKNYKEALLNRI